MLLLIALCTSCFLGSFRVPQKVSGSVESELRILLPRSLYEACSLNLFVYLELGLEMQIQSYINVASESQCQSRLLGCLRVPQIGESTYRPRMTAKEGSD